ncbi:MAG: PDZ domain-containing protein [Planctomycetes bacterium]|nr:PDZ domain-containing protein [Planctomycetota bacterium]
MAAAVRFGLCTLAGFVLGGLLAACAGVPEGSTSPELGRVNEAGAIVRYAVRSGGRIERARLVPEAESWFGGFVEPPRAGETGLRVSEIFFGGVADRAGLWIGDHLLRLGERELADVEDFRAALLATAPGARIPLQYRRRDRLLTAELVFRARREAIAARYDLPGVASFRDDRLAGFEVVTVPARLAGSLYGVAATRAVVSDVLPGCPAYRAGIRAGDCLVTLADQPVSTAAEVRALLADRGPGERLEIAVEQGGARLEAWLELSALSDVTFVDIPLLLRVNDRCDGSEVRVGTVLLGSESGWLPTPRREGLRKLAVSLFLGLVRWEQGRSGREIRLLWVLPIGV